MLSGFEQKLNHFDLSVRRQALHEIIERIENGEIQPSCPSLKVNIHIHSFFSYNCNGWSPSRIAWEAYKTGLETVGIVDFDVLDGLEEFHGAGELLGVKTVAGVETRVFIPELADKVITSPNEPGVHYMMAQGCGRIADGCMDKLSNLRQVSESRNLQVMERLNDYLPDIALDYAHDVQVLTPSGNATERHLMLAYDRKAKEVFGSKSDEFWARVLDMSVSEARSLMADRPKFHERLRTKLVKFGSAGYVQPESGSFPSIDEFVKLACSIGAVPNTAWLDGTSEGERDVTANLEFMMSKGVSAINIIPERNWNIADLEEKSLKLKKLREVVEAARAFGLPISVGTEMNQPGQPFVDDFSAPELADFVDDFIDGAHFFYGHTLLSRYADFCFYSDVARAAFGDKTKEKIMFFTKVGTLAKPGRRLYDKLREQAGLLEPGKIIEILERER